MITFNIILKEINKYFDFQKLLIKIIEKNNNKNNWEIIIEINE